MIDTMVISLSQPALPAILTSLEATRRTKPDQRDFYVIGRRSELAHTSLRVHISFQDKPAAAA